MVIRKIDRINNGKEEGILDRSRYGKLERYQKIEKNVFQKVKIMET